MEVTRALRGVAQYSNDLILHYGRYLGIIRELNQIDSVMQWMNENRPSWVFMERDVLDFYFAESDSSTYVALYAADDVTYIDPSSGGILGNAALLPRVHRLQHGNLDHVLHKVDPAHTKSTSHHRDEVG